MRSISRTPVPGEGKYLRVTRLKVAPVGIGVSAQSRFGGACALNRVGGLQDGYQVRIGARRLALDGEEIGHPGQIEEPTHAIGGRAQREVSTRLHDRLAKRE